MSESAIRIGLIYPELLGTYGDRGNVRILERRLTWRQVPCEVVSIPAGSPVPSSLDCLVLGGAEDVAQTLAAEGLIASAGAIGQALDRGAVMLAVCAGFQLLGQSYARFDGKIVAGLGLLEATTVAGTRRRIGEAVIDSQHPDLGLISGFENHAGITTLGPEVRPLGSMVAGCGNGDGRDGVIIERHILATYLHGPVLARNPCLADLLLCWVAGPLAPLDDDLATRLRDKQLSASASSGGPRGWSLIGRRSRKLKGSAASVGGAAGWAK